MYIFIKPLQIFLAILFLGLVFSSCERSINPFEDDQGIYSVYGALEIGKDPHIIRVRNLNEPFSADSTFPLDATVTFTDLGTGETTQLRDTTVDFEVGRTHNFILNQNLDLNSQYQITVERTDGAQVSSIATTPELTEVSYAPFEFIYCETQIEFRFKNVKQEEFIRMEIGAYYQGDIHWAEMDLVGEIKYDPLLKLHKVRMSPRNLLVEVFTPVLPDNPYYDPYTLFPTVSCNQLDRDILEIRYTHFGPEWSAGLSTQEGLLDIESGDVENGLGFFGAYRVDSFSIPLSGEEPEDL